MRCQVEISGSLEARAAAARALAAAGIDVIDGGELAPRPIRIGDLVIDVAGHQASRDGRRVRLTRQEWSLLAVLAAAHGRVVARAELLARAWGYRFDPGTNLLAVHVCRLRAKIGPGAILSVGDGYRLAVGNDPRGEALEQPEETAMAKPPETPPNSDIDGVNMDARVGEADRGGHDDPGGAVKHSKDESKARPTESKPPE